MRQAQSFWRRTRKYKEGGERETDDHERERENLGEKKAGRKQVCQSDKFRCKYLFTESQLMTQERNLFEIL